MMKRTIDQEARVGTSGWLRPAIAVAAIGWGANQFAPLIVMYQQHGLSVAATQVMFALYAVGLVPALLVGGRWSDRAGRRVVVMTALLLSLAASVVLMTGSAWHGLLFPGRLLAGVSSGLAFGTGAAWIRELSALDAHHTAGPRRATVAMTIGFGGGPLAAGLVAQHLSRPELWPYVPQIALAALALLSVGKAGDSSGSAGAATVAGSTARDASLRKHLLLVSAPFAPWVFGTAAVALAYLPALVADRAGSQPLAFAAVATAIPAFAGVLVQPLVARLRPGGRLGLLQPAMIVAVLALIVAAWAASAATVWAVLVAAAVLGAAYGVTQFAGLADVQRVADPSRLGLATSAYQALSYLGFALPYLLTLGHTHLGWSPVTGLGAVAILAVASLLWLTLHGRLARRAAHCPANEAAPSAPVSCSAPA
ncbi:MFS transporter [Mycobacterium sp. 852002-51057_SCH5723018]|uniref:MFS transporter n=1 Tax=Mycobacterium sp. 852002-51057_SCH5723018 TaxID=1834094 RepID=UPI0018D406FF|nr:MFS transporter [Mycobacterium sp. 852002-51057_SCH5723018]